jgi:hypothetical protein
VGNRSVIGKQDSSEMPDYNNRDTRSQRAEAHLADTGFSETTQMVEAVSPILSDLEGLDLFSRAHERCLPVPFLNT